MENSEKQHISIVIAGHVDSGKSSFTGRLLYDMGNISQREKDKLQAEADALGKGSFVFAFYTDNQKAERERGITINYNCKDFYTNRYHYTIIDAPGHRDFVKNMLSGSSAADVGCLMVPADSFTVAMAKKNKDEGTVEGQTRQHALLLNLLGLKQLIVQINKMDMVNYSEEKFNEIKAEVQNMLISVGWPKPFVMNNVPIIPISAWHGDNLLNPSSNMQWFTGTKVKNTSGEIVNVCTSMDALDTFVQPPQRFPDKPLRLCVSNIYNIKGTGTVVAGRIEQGTLKPGDQVKFLPKHSDTLPCKGRIFAIEMHHQECPSAGPGDNVGLNIKGLTKENMPKAGDIMVLESYNSKEIKSDNSEKKTTYNVSNTSNCDIKTDHLYNYFRTHEAIKNNLNNNEVLKLGLSDDSDDEDTDGIFCTEIPPSQNRFVQNSVNVCPQENTFRQNFISSYPPYLPKAIENELLQLEYEDNTYKLSVKMTNLNNYPLIKILCDHISNLKK